MKKYLFALLLIVFSIDFAKAQNPKAEVDSAVIKLTAEVKRLQEEMKIVKKTDKKEGHELLTRENLTANEANLSSLEWVIVFLPSAFFLLMFYYFMGWLKKDSYKLADALSSCDPVKISDPEKSDGSKIDVLPRSSSRMIAFLTGLAAIVVALGVLTVQFYGFLTENKSFETDGMWKLLLSLGIGVIPYGINMFTKNDK